MKTTRKILSVLDSKLTGKRRISPSVEELSIVFVSDPEIHKYNLAYRGKDKPTDVLSFSLLEGENKIGTSSLGDVMISLKTAKKQAKEYGVTFSEEILRLLIHGILHLCGFDHENVPRRKVLEMQRFEDLLFRECRKMGRIIA